MAVMTGAPALVMMVVMTGVTVMVMTVIIGALALMAALVMVATAMLALVIAATMVATAMLGGALGLAKVTVIRTVVKTIALLMAETVAVLATFAVQAITRTPQGRTPPGRSGRPSHRPLSTPQRTVQLAMKVVGILLEMMRGRLATECPSHGGAI